MPRGQGASHQAQVTAISDAALRVLDRDGIAALSFRNVAAEAGVSPGRVQHYFRTSEGLAAATFRRARERVRSDIERELDHAGEAPPRAVIEATLCALVPRSPSQTAELRVAQLVELHSATDPDIHEELRSGRLQLVEFLAAQVAAARSESNGMPAHEDRAQADDLHRVALALLATAEGLANLTLADVVTSEQARDLLDRVIEVAVRAAP